MIANIVRLIAASLAVAVLFAIAPVTANAAPGPHGKFAVCKSCPVPMAAMRHHHRHHRHHRHMMMKKHM